MNVISRILMTDVFIHKMCRICGCDQKGKRDDNLVPPKHYSLYMYNHEFMWGNKFRNYNQIEGVYEHQVIIHESHFVDPDDRNVHTQYVENLQMQAKRKLRRQLGSSLTLFPSYIP
ncbi:hypothetical protein HHI36_001440 [Cryptolaemus montrouzieri]|uniref:Uncharacterized protein n=1 Tax=Cryptolaemus montrouzieri TaxID=559131 RepID=A0ABD2P7E7_9CUCU